MDWKQGSVPGLGGNARWRRLAWAAAAVLAAAPAPGRAAASHSEVVLLVSQAAPISRAIAEYYRAQRGVPAENVIRLDLPLPDPTLSTNLHESISRADFVARIRDPVLAALEARGLRDRVRILVTTKGLPLRVLPDAAVGDEILRRDTGASLEAELALLGSGLDGSAGVEGSRNPYFRSEESFEAFRAAHPQAALRYLVARLDGYQTPLDRESGVPRDVKALIDRAAAPAAGGLFVVDEHPGMPAHLDAANRAWLLPAAALLGTLGVPLLHDRERSMVSGAEGIAGYASWGSNDPDHGPPPFYGALRLPDGSSLRIPGTFAPGAISIDLVSTNARSLLFPTSYGQSLVADLVRLGVAGAAGHVSEPTLVAVPRPQVLLPCFAEGVPAGEAFFRSLPFLGWQNVWIGDPLLRRAPPWPPPTKDADGDSVPDSQDNCLEIPNLDQRDTDADGYGNLCDPDLDQDGLVTTAWDPGAAHGRAFDLERIAAARGASRYDPDADLDGDGRVDEHDIGLAQLWLFQAPGPSGRGRPLEKSGPVRPAEAGR